MFVALAFFICFVLLCFGICIILEIRREKQIREFLRQPPPIMDYDFEEPETDILTEEELNE
jgi:hypothetical protein